MREPLIWTSLAWDTEFFGVKTVRLWPKRFQRASLDRALAECQQSGIEVAYALLDSDDDTSVCLVEATGFHLVDVRMTLEWKATNFSPIQVPTDLILRNYEDKDLRDLQAIATGSYRHSRYYYDQHYHLERCDSLYVTWIQRDCQGGAERVIVAERAGAVIGYITCHLSADEGGQISLVGIQEGARGGGVGRQLVQAAQSWFVAQGVHSVSVVTQSRNIEAQRLYQRCNFLTQSVQLWYHKWFTESI
jgi:ribosomal protein S18 acetylase RimI-like enzyme